MLDIFGNLTMADDEEKTFAGDYPFDLSAGKQLIFIYVNIIEYQYVGDTKAPLIRVIDSKQRLKNGSPCKIEPTHKIVFSNLEYKKLLSKDVQSNEIQLRTETGQLVPFAGTGKNGSLLSTAIGITIFFRTLSPTRKWFWGFSGMYWQSCLADCKKVSLACS